MVFVRKLKMQVHTKKPTDHVHNNVASNVTPSSWSLYLFPEIDNSMSVHCIYSRLTKHVVLHNKTSVSVCLYICKVCSDRVFKTAFWHIRAILHSSLSHSLIHSFIRMLWLFHSLPALSNRLGNSGNIQTQQRR